MILTVQSTGNGSYRLGISLQDSYAVFGGERGAVVRLLIEDQTIETKTTCGPPLNKGFDLYSKSISKWIVKRNFNNYTRGKPIKLEFEYELIGSIHILKYVQPVSVNTSFDC